MNDHKPHLRSFLSRFVHDYQLKDDEDIFQTGYVNSMLAMQLVAFMEKEFRVKIENDDLELANFQTLNALSALITRKGGQAR
jgi:acyl carrier protein